MYKLGKLILDGYPRNEKLTIINNGEANIEMREAQLMNPTNILRTELSSICKLPTIMITNIPKTASSNPNILTYQITVLDNLVTNN